MKYVSFSYLFSPYAPKINRNTIEFLAGIECKDNALNQDTNS